MTYRDASGEIAIEPTWTRCVVCNSPTAQPPVCFDLRCEMAIQDVSPAVHD